MSDIIQHQAAPVANLPATTAFGLVERALEKGADIATLEKLIELQERTERNNARRAFDQAIASAKAEFPEIGKAKSVSHGVGKTSFKHETLSDIAAAINPSLSRYGLSFRFNVQQEAQIKVTCIIAHKDGHSEETTLQGAPDASGAKNSIQAIGSTVTYLQRYTLKAALGLSSSDIDDDGAGASAPASVSPEQFIALRDLADEKGVDHAVICRAYKVASLEFLKASDYESAMARLKKTGSAQ